LINSLVLAVIGPTASGKTATSLALSKEYNGEIVCCDSMQVYKHMKIGTASPTEDELNQAKHHLFNFVETTTNYNAALYQKDARDAIDDILKKGKVPILCGGTGLYLKAALYSVNFSLSSSDEDYRRSLEKLYQDKGAAHLHSMLEKKDPESAQNIHENNVKRIIRALEILHISGVKKSEQKQKEQKHYNSFIVGLKHEREKLYERINKRVDMMVREGLEDEVRNLVEKGLPSKSNAMQAIGYKEWLDYFEGKINIEKCISNIKQNSRHYAKRQLTWFNKMDVTWYDYDFTTLHNYTNIFSDVKK